MKTELENPSDGQEIFKSIYPLRFFDARRRPVIGGVIISQVAGRLFYCQPRVDDLKWYDYHSVEIGLLRHFGKKSKRGLVSPEELGLNSEKIGIDFDSGRSPVAGYVTQFTVVNLELALIERMLRTKTRRERLKFQRRAKKNPNWLAKRYPAVAELTVITDASVTKSNPYDPNSTPITVAAK